MLQLVAEGVGFEFGTITLMSVLTSPNVFCEYSNYVWLDNKVSYNRDNQRKDMKMNL